MLHKLNYPAPGQQERDVTAYVTDDGIIAPVAYPEEGGQYVWDEEATDWVEVTDETV